MFAILSHNILVSKQASLSHALTRVTSHLTPAQIRTGPRSGRSFSPTRFCVRAQTPGPARDTTLLLLLLPSPPGASANAHRLPLLNLPSPSSECVRSPSVRDAPPRKNHEPPIPKPFEKCTSKRVAVLRVDEYGSRGGEWRVVSAESRDQDDFIESAKEIEFPELVNDS
jgi:hypothetical protein